MDTPPTETQVKDRSAGQSKSDDTNYYECSMTLAGDHPAAKNREANYHAQKTPSQRPIHTLSRCHTTVARADLTRSRRQNGAIKDANLASNPEVYWEQRGETLHPVVIISAFGFVASYGGNGPGALTLKTANDSFAPLSTEKVVKRQERKPCTRC